MKFQPLKQTPVLISAGAIAVVSVLALLQPDLFQRLENMTYDWRARLALRFPAPVDPNFGFVQIDDESIDAVKNGELGYHYGLYWPRQVYGRLVNELNAQGAETIAFDILFGELRSDHPSVSMADGSYIESDDYFAEQITQAKNVILATTTNTSPPELFAAAAVALGEISTDKDSDGILRRAKAFTWHRRWNPILRELETKPGSRINLRRARLEPGHLSIPLGNAAGEELDIPLDDKNRFRFDPPEGDPDSRPRWEPVFTSERVWHLGIVLAARHLMLDLANAEIDLKHGRIKFTGAGGVTRTIPVDSDARFWVDWSLTADDPRLTVAPALHLLRQNRERLLGESIQAGPDWKGKVVVVGSSAQGNDLTDLGATPLQNTAFLVSKHWNVANSLVTGRFIRQLSAGLQILVISCLGLATAILAWRLRVLPGLVGVVFLAVAYVVICVALYVQQRLWLPMVLPVGGVMLVHYGLLTAHRAIFEQREKRRVKSVFSKIVAPDVVNELLRAESVSLGGARREVTVMFADVRGFTELTDKVQEESAARIKEFSLSAETAEKYYDEVAAQTLEIISLYLGLIADIVKRHGGTLDKYIGDCAMAFWGAPKGSAQHARDCVRAAIDAQRSIHTLNEQRREQNARLEQENIARQRAGLHPKLILPLLHLGTGVNSGAVLVGLMGSDEHGLNYTVLGREVNLASRLEGVSGRGRIIIGEATYALLRKEDPALAASCIEQEPTQPKGFQKPVRIFEVPWQESNGLHAPTGQLAQVG